MFMNKDIMALFTFSQLCYNSFNFSIQSLTEGQCFKSISTPVTFNSFIPISFTNISINLFNMLINSRNCLLNTFYYHLLHPV